MEFEHLFTGGFFRFDISQQDFSAANVELIREHFSAQQELGIGSCVCDEERADPLVPWSHTMISGSGFQQASGRPGLVHLPR